MEASDTPKAAAKCTVMMLHGGKECGREAYDDKGRCICHSEKPDKNVQSFNAAVEQVFVSQDLDFTRFVFPEGAAFGWKHFASKATFWCARFLGRVRFQRATFQGEAAFVDVVFHGGADFNEAVFQGEAKLHRATFGGEADFTGAAFHGAARFQEAIFQGEARFWAAAFQGEVDFWYATFLGEASFVSTKFQSETSFGGAEFEGGVDFRHAQFRDRLVFYDARLQGKANFWMTAFPTEAEVSFERVTLDQPERAVFCHVSLGRARFRGTDMRRVDFTNVEWARRPFWGERWRPVEKRDDGLGRAIRWTSRRWPAWAKPRGRFELWDELGPDDQGSREDYALIGKLYRQLKHNYEEQRDPITAGDFHFGEMHMRRLSNPPKNPLLRFLKRDLSFLALYRWISGYGEDYALALGWIVAVIVGFAAASSWVPALALQTVPHSSPPQPVHGLGPHLVYSVLCLLFRGNTLYQPTHFWGHCASVVEGVIGAPLIAMFVLALNRRFKR